MESILCHGAVEGMQGGWLKGDKRGLGGGERVQQMALEDCGRVEGGNGDVSGVVKG